MRRITLRLRLVACFAVASLASAATVVRSTSPIANTALAIDGAFSTFLLSWEGGDVRGSVVSAAATSGAPATKSVGGAACGPLVVQVAFPPPASLIKWINELCSNQSSRRTLRLTDYDAMGVAVGAFEATGVMLTEVTFPAFDATVTTVEPMRLVFSAEQSRVVQPGGTPMGSIAPRTTGTSFSLQIDGLDTKRVMRVEPITVTRTNTTEALGAARDYTKPPATTAFSNLRVIAAASGAETWRTWHTDFVVNGNSADANEKRGSVAFIQSDGKPADVALNFGQLGILRVSRRSVAQGAVPAVEAEFYFERLDLGTPIATSSSASVAGDLVDKSAVTDVSARAPSDIIQVAPTTDSTAPLAGTRTALADSVALKSTTATPLAVATVLNPADQGSRDPAAFPRADGLTRVNYSGTFQKAYTSEAASYTSKEAIYDLVRRVDATAKAGGWTMTSLSEADSPNGKTVSEGWAKPPATASLSFQEPKDGSGTTMSLSVYVQIPAAN